MSRSFENKLNLAKQLSNLSVDTLRDEDEFEEYHQDSRAHSDEEQIIKFVKKIICFKFKINLY